MDVGNTRATDSGHSWEEGTKHHRSVFVGRIFTNRNTTTANYAEWQLALQLKKV